MRRPLFAAVAALLAALAVGPTPVRAATPTEAATPQEARLRPPVFGTNIHGDGARNFADPSIVRVGGRYYAYSTTQFGQVRRIMVMSSTNLWDWEFPGGATGPTEALARPPAWARDIANGGEFWAPSVIRTAGRYVMYFAARHKSVSAARPGWCIGVATSATPAGPFQPRDTPLFCRLNSSSSTPASFSGSPAQDRGAIDPQVFRAPNGRLFLYFKALNNLYQLWGVRLTANGLNRSGPAYGLVPIDSQARTWEYSTRLHFTVLENPNMVYNPAPGVQRRYLLTYAGGEWQIPGNYGTGYAACTSPLAGCARLTTQRPWLYSRGSNAGPGGASTFTVPLSGGRRESWIAYHTWERGHVGQYRRLHVEPLRFAGVNPRLASRRPTGTIAGSALGGGSVSITGTADDPDTGRPVRLSIRRDGTQVATATTGANRSWNPGVLTNQPAGSHVYCARAIDDNGLTPRVIGCVTIAV
jgi:hypothetical protein